MSTNFYLLYWGGQDHIGKRLGAGPYCWDCNITLCKQGVCGIGYSSSEWYDQCPKCGKEGRRGSMRFIWAMDPDELSKRIDKGEIRDEYDKKYEYDEFMEMIKNCPIITYDIGSVFC